MSKITLTLVVILGLASLSAQVADPSDVAVYAEPTCVEVDDDFTIVATGLEPGVSYDFVIEPRPDPLEDGAVVEADGNGVAKLPGTIPASVETGEFTWSVMPEVGEQALATTDFLIAETCPVPDPSGSFVDDDDNVHEGNIEAIAATGITFGCDDDRFCPDDAVTRDQMAAFLNRALHLDAVDTDTFVDDDGSAFEPDIEALAAADITLGCDSDRFCPDDHVTRGQMAAFLNRALPLDPADTDTFVDDDGSAFEADIEAIAAAGITLGCDNDRFCPDDHVTRGQMASFLVRGFGFPDATATDRFVDDDGSVHEAAIDAVAQAGVTLGCNPPDNDRFCPQDLVARDQMASFLGRGLDLEPRTPQPASAGTDDRMSDPFPGEDSGQLVEIRVGEHGFFDRVVFEFENDLPGWSTMLEDPPLLGGTSGIELDIEGNAFISVVFNPAAAQYAAGTYDGPDRIESQGVVVTEVVEFDDFEGVNSWAIGLTDDAAYAVGWLDDPARFVVDVMHG